jgi:predicted RNA-binding Zn-ribbon protein involved in translation (DUF1610 family)
MGLICPHCQREFTKFDRGLSKPLLILLLALAIWPGVAYFILTDVFKKCPGCGKKIDLREGVSVKCPSCSEQFRSVKIFSMTIFVLLSLLVIIPGIIYWLSSSKPERCPVCHSDTSKVKPLLVACPNCGQTFERAKFKSGFSWFTFGLLLAVGGIPGLLYWMGAHDSVKCPGCGVTIR